MNDDTDRTTADGDPHRNRPDTGRTRPDRTPSSTRSNESLTARRRDVLQAIGAGAVLGTLGTAPAGASNHGMEFVETDGTNFVVDGDPVYLDGSNNFWITDPYSDLSRIDDVLALYDEMGLNLLRTWAFCEGGGGHCLQPEPGVHDEAALQHLDYLVAKAAEHGIRLVLTFVDNWDAYGGIPQYVSWASGASEHGDFYVNQECRDLYKNHVETLLTRENSITGVEYRNDPAIAIWELANEPRFEQDASSTIDDHHGTLHDWFADMSSFVKSLDGNHLVSTGAEGFYTRSDGANWMYDDWTGQDFVENNSIDTVDVCSFHMYPYHWPGMGLAGQMASDDIVNGVQWITEHVRDAHEQVGKPVHLGEFNVNVQENDLQTRKDRLGAWYDALDQHDANAATVWQLVLESTQDHDGFQVYRSESGSILEEYATTVRAKSGSADGTPTADATAPTTLRVGESGDFNGAYSFDPGGTIASYEWAFGDGSTATGQRAAHRFDATGSHEVSLTVTDEGGDADSDAEVLTVEDLPADSFLVEAAGETLHRDTKEFHFASVPVTGDVTVEARVADVEPTSPEAQAGVMVADDPTAPGALGAATITPGSGSELTRAYDSTTWRERASDSRSPPLWLRVERTGGSVAASVSADGSDWTQIGSGDVDLPEEVHVGLFVSSNSPGELCAAQFDEVTWLDGWASTDVGDVQVAGHTTAGSGGSGTDTTPPAVPSNLSVAGSTTSSVDLSWDAASDESGGSGMDHYNVYVDGSLDQQVAAGTTATTVANLAAGTSYQVGVSAVDGAGNESSRATAQATTQASDDGTAPTAPSNLSVTGTTTSSVDVNWDASTDSGGSGLDHYAVSVDGGQDHTVAAGTTSTSVSGLSADTSYEIGVSAVDGAGNESPTTVRATTDADSGGGGLVVNDYDGSPAWSGQNDLDNWNGAGSFQNGGGDGEVVDGELVLQYDDAGWAQERIDQDVSDYTDLVFEIRGESGGEGEHFVISLGGATNTFADVADSAVGTTSSAVRIDMQAAGIDRSAPAELQLDFWQGGSGASTIYIEEIRFE